MDDFVSVLKPTLAARRLANGGPLSAELERRLSEMLGVPHLSLVSNGTVAIEIAAKALNFRGKVVTTPFTFPATLGALLWVGLDPILVDIEEDYLTLKPSAVESVLDDKTTGIIGVHVYGCPCDLDSFSALSKKYNVPVLYDGAHVFDATYKGKPILSYGDATTLSFHATKQFNTGEGGAIVAGDIGLHERTRVIKNFGIESEDVISELGINGKLSELNAAFGLANLNVLFEERQRRRSVAEIYKNELEGHRNVTIVPQRPSVSEAYNYFAIRLPVVRGKSLRDVVYSDAKDKGIFLRKYFNPLLSEIGSYTKYMTQKEFHIPNAVRAAQEVLVLPLHGGIGDDDARAIARLVKASLASA